jgi:glycosyltransferase involved in cell wall biosynthesis
MTSNEPFVSIITPSYNSRRYINETIQSVLSQDYDSLEHIIIDGGSTDGTQDILKEYQHLIWISEPDDGQSDAINKGIQMARGEVIGWINSDDTYNADTIQKVANHFLSKSQCSMIYSHCNYINEKGELLFTHYVQPFDIVRHIVDNEIPQPTIFIKKKVFESVGLLDTKLHYVMDWDLFLRIGYFYKIDMIDDVYANFRMWSETKTSTHPEKFLLERLAVYNRFYNIPNLPEEVQEVKAKAYARAYWQLNCIYHTKEYNDLDIPDKAELKMAMNLYPLFSNDLDFVIDQVVHYAIQKVEIDFFEEYTNNLFKEVALPRKRLKYIINKSMAHLYASLLLLIKDGQYRPNGITYYKQNIWLMKALKLDPLWILNRGIQSLILRQILKLKYARTL